MKDMHTIGQGISLQNNCAHFTSQFFHHESKSKAQTMVKSTKSANKSKFNSQKISQFIEMPKTSLSMKNHMIKPPAAGHPAATNNKPSHGNSNNPVTVKLVIPGRSHSIVDIVTALESVCGRSDVDIATVKG